MYRNGPRAPAGGAHRSHRRVERPFGTDGVVHFLAEMVSEEHGTIVYTGRILGNDLDATYLWTRDRWYWIVEVPAVLTAVDEDVDGAGTEGIGKSEQPVLAQHPGDEVLQGVPQVQLPQRAGASDPVVGNGSHVGLLLPPGHVVGCKVQVVAGEVGIVGAVTEVRLVSHRVRLPGKFILCPRIDETREHAKARFEVRGAALLDEGAGAGAAHVRDGIALQIHHLAGTVQALHFVSHLRSPGTRVGSMVHRYLAGGDAGENRRERQDMPPSSFAASLLPTTCTS